MRTDDPEFETVMQRSTVWFSGRPKLEGVAKFIVAVRGPFDDERMTRKDRQAEGGGFQAWETDMKMPTVDWAERFFTILQDGQSRTFNQLMLEATGNRYTADVGLGENAEDALWLLVEQDYLWWSDEVTEGCLWFALNPAHI